MPELNFSVSDPFSVPMVFFRIGWMNQYAGIAGDEIRGGGKFVREQRYGHEIFNFKPYHGRMFGYVQTMARDGKWFEGTIKTDRIVSGDETEAVDGVLVVWTATDPQGGGYIVGWYRNATVYRHWQPPPEDPSRQHGGSRFGYYATCRAEDAHLLSMDERVIPVPRGKGGFGQSNIWYADDRENAEHARLRQEVLQLVAEGMPQAPEEHGRKLQPDDLVRQLVERRAVMEVVSHFEALGYAVRSVERDNVGWDLEATLGRRLLRLEVKGLSGPTVSVGLTPNEYAMMKQHRDSYRLCVVTDALISPGISVFAHSAETGHWETTEGRRLEIQEVVAARCTA